MDLSEFSFRVRALERKLYKTAICILKNDMDACDAVQNALLKAWENLNKLKNEEFFDTWLTRILINECKMLIRTVSKYREDELTDAVPAPEGAENEIESALNAIEEKYRVPLVLYHINGYSVEETACILNVPAGTIKTRLSRGRTKLKALLESEEKT